MMNLFSIFDPATSTHLSMNWMASIMVFILFPFKKWVSSDRCNFMITNLTNYLFKEFSPIVKKMTFILSISVAFFMFIMFNNAMGLFPYIFTSSAHMTFTLPLALTTWLALMIYGWMNNYNNLLIHLIPQGTPYVLMPFMVLIETISNIIRPGTLAIRLTANMIAGHLLMVLLSSALASAPLSLFSLVFSAQVMLSALEVAVSFIQAYVFSVLVTLYMAEFAD